MPPQVSAVLLAAGSARRMGSLKQLLPLGERSVIRHCLDTLIASGISDIVTVLGPKADEILKIISGLPVTIAINHCPESGMAESVRKGIAFIKPSATGIMVCLSDHPLISADTFRALALAHAEMPDEILVPTYSGRKGHPALFPRTAIEELSLCSTLREIIHRVPERVSFIDVTDEGVILDMDTPKDYEKILEISVKRSPRH